jgi:protein O-GlcNAc transferase
MPTELDRAQIEGLLRQADDCLAQGNLSAAEVACREVLDRDRGNVRALNTLKAVIETIGVPEHALTGLGPGSPPRAAGPRYLLIKAWGCGFWSDVNSVLGALLLAEITHRIPVVHWGANSLFGDGSGRDAFGHFFEPVSSVGLRDLPDLHDRDFFPPKWTSGNLQKEDHFKWQGPYSRLSPTYYIGRPERVAVCDFFVGVVDVMPWIPRGHPMQGRRLVEIYRWLIKKYLRPREHILGRCDDFIRSRLAGRRFAAVHVRGSDKVLEIGNLEEVNQAYPAAIEAIDPAWPIFLLTDDARWLDIIKRRFGDRVVTTSCRRTGTAKGVHKLAGKHDRVGIGMEVMVDAYIAARADRFLGNGGSAVSSMICLLKDWPPGTCVLTCPPRIFERNVWLYLLDPNKASTSLHGLGGKGTLPG